MSGSPDPTAADPFAVALDADDLKRRSVHGLRCWAGLALVAWLYGDPRVVVLMIVLGVLSPVSAPGINPTALPLRWMRFGTMGCNEVAATLAGVAAAVVCARQGWSYRSLVAGQFSASGKAVA